MSKLEGGFCDPPSSLMTNPAPEAKPATPPWILVVDDDLMVRNLMETVLTAEGWKVVLAEGAAAAVKRATDAATPPAVMICDVLMPKTDGLALTRAMLARVPDLKVILISGHLADAAWFPGDLGKLRLLRKPFKNAELVAAVNEAIQSRGPRA
jgi:two-component system cell cycle sensor histidine kinase/response regulator CckA